MGQTLTSKWYGTFNQWRQLDGRVMRRPPHVPEGQWGCQICFWTPVTKTIHTDEGDEEDRFFVLRMYTVFCIDQVEGKHLDHLRAGQVDTGEPLAVDYQPAEDAIGATGATSASAGARRFIRRAMITSRCRQKPLSRAWTNSMALASTNCATGLSIRAAWTGPARSGRTPTPLGELVAEIGSCFLCRELGVPASENLENHIAYVGNWLQAMRSDPRFIFTASAQASKAADFILSFSRKPEKAVEADGELVTA